MEGSQCTPVNNLLTTKQLHCLVAHKDAGTIKKEVTFSLQLHTAYVTINWRNKHSG